MKVEETPLDGVRLIQPRMFRDPRGHFLEMWNVRRYAEAGLDHKFVQDNVSVSRKGVVRGLHYQYPNGQAKLVAVLEGEIWDVVVDVRRNSPTFGRWYGVSLSAETGRQLFIPEGFGHGFCVLTETAVVSYKCTDFYSPAAEQTVLWNDPTIGIEWPLREPLLSEKDARGVALLDLPPDRLPPIG